MEYNKRTIKLEQYKEKLKEREFNNDTYFLDKFSNNNNNRLDRTLNPKKNSLINQENQIFSNNDFSRTSRRNATPNINYINNNNNNNIDNSNMIYNNNSNLPNIDNKNNINTINVFNNNINNANNNNSITNLNNYSRPRTQNLNKNYIQNNNNAIDYSKDPFGNSYRGAGIIPRDRGANIKEDQLNQNKMLKEIWALEMEEKKMK